MDRKPFKFSFVLLCSSIGLLLLLGLFLRDAFTRDYDSSTKRAIIIFASFFLLLFIVILLIPVFKKRSARHRIKVSTEGINAILEFGKDGLLAADKLPAEVIALLYHLKLLDPNRYAALRADSSYQYHLNTLLSLDLDSSSRIEAETNLSEFIKRFLE